jgi:hypothetical protein
VGGGPCRARFSARGTGGLMTLDEAKTFAARWFGAWNAHRLGGSVENLDAIMACYADEIEHSSPFIARFNAAVGGGDTLRGKAAVAAYFGRALAMNPTPPGVTRFEPMHIAAGTGSVLVVYRRWTGEIAGEVFFVNATGLIVRSVSHYG